MTIRRFALFSLSILVLLGALAETSQAIPAFGRKHEFSCTTCHQPFPRLKAFGEDFAGNAFAPSDREMPPRYFRDVGDDQLSLLKSIPLAIRADMYADIRTNDSEIDGFSDFKTPFGLKILSGGRVADNIGYYFYFFMNERGEVAGIEDAYIHFNDLLGVPLDIMVGQFQVSDPLFKRELRLTFQDYLVYKASPGSSATDLTYDRGLMITGGFDFGLDVTAIVVNGNGKGEANVQRDFDMDRYKHFMLRLSQGLGPVRLGAFGYYGKEQTEMTDLGNSEQWTGTNELNMWGLDATLALGPAEINCQYLERRDLNPNFGRGNDQNATLTRGILMEAIAELWGDPARLYMVLLFNYVDSTAIEARQESYTANLTFLLRSNIKLLTEYTFAPLVSGVESNEHRATIGIVAGF